MRRSSFELYASSGTVGSQIGHIFKEVEVHQTSCFKHFIYLMLFLVVYFVGFSLFLKCLLIH